MDDLDRIVAVLAGYRFSVRTEAQLQDDIADVLGLAGIPAAREVRLTAKDRPDFLTPDGVAVEVKARRGWSTTTLLRQLLRYTAADQVKAVLVVTNDPRHADIPAELGGKPVHVHVVRGALA